MEIVKNLASQFNPLFSTLRNDLHPVVAPDEPYHVTPTGALYIYGICYGFDCFVDGEDDLDPVLWPLQLLLFPIYLWFAFWVSLMQSIVPWSVELA